MAEILIPLIALVALLVVWAKCCPEIKEPERKTWTRYYFPNARLKAVADEMGKLTLSFQAFAATGAEAERALTLYVETHDQPDL